MTRAALLVICVALLATPTLADTHYVSKGGSNTYPYASWATAPLGGMTYDGSGLWTGLEGVVVDGRYAYCSMVFGLLIVDISEPTQPVFKSRVYIPDGYGRRLKKLGSVVYMARHGAGLYAIDVSDPLSPAVLSQTDIPGHAYNVVADSPYVYVSTWSGVLNVVDVTVPTAPSVPATYSPGCAILNMAIADDRLYMACQDSGLIVLDISHPPTASLIRRLPLGGSVLAVAADSDRVFVQTGTYPFWLFSLGVANPDTVLRLDSLLGLDQVFGGVYRFLLHENRLYASDYDDIKIIDVAPQSPLQVLATYEASRPVFGMDAESTLVYVGAINGGLEIVDVGGAGSPQMIGKYDFPHNVHSVLVRETYAYVSALRDGLLIADISRPERPVVVGRYDTPSQTRDVTLFGDIAYVADAHGPLLIVDVSSPASPSSLGVVLGTSPDDVCVQDSTLYVADNHSGLLIYRLSDPQNPRHLGSYATNGFGHVLTVAGEFAYLSYSRGPLEIVNVSNPAIPTHAGGYAAVSDIKTIHVIDSLAYISAYMDGLLILNVANPSTPTLIGAWNPGEAMSRGLAISGDYAYVAHRVTSASMLRSAFRMIDVSDPSQPIAVGSFAYTTPGSPGSMVVHEGNIYAADQVALTVLRATPSTAVHEGGIIGPEQFTLSPNYPNPFNASTTIRYTLPAPSPVTLSIHNILGQRVRVLVDQAMPAGEHSVNWNGRDRNGSDVASGVYFIVMQAGGEQVVRKAMVVK